MIYHIIRQQLVPPGKDTVIGEVDDTQEDIQEVLTLNATLEAKERNDVHHISISSVGRNQWAALIGCPGNAYSHVSTMVRFVVKPKGE